MHSMHRDRADSCDPNCAGAGPREVDRAFRFGGHPVVHAYDYGAAVLFIDYAHPRSERQGFVRRRRGIRIELLAARGPPRVLVPDSAPTAEVSPTADCGPGGLESSLRASPVCSFEKSGEMEGGSSATH